MYFLFFIINEPESVKRSLLSIAEFFQSKFVLSFYKMGKQIIVIKQHCSKLLLHANDSFFRL